MARNMYEYSTSPRKLEPDYNRKSKKRNLKVVKDMPRQDVKLSSAQKERQAKLTLSVIGRFILLLTISYRNSQINEKFTEIQTLKKELSATQKENEQLKVNIENNLNLNTIEKMAKEKLGMQKLTNRQTVYINLPKKDYVEPASEKILKNNNENWFQKLTNKLFNK